MDIIMHKPAQPVIHELYCPTTSTWQFVVADPKSRHAVIIDPVLDYEPDISGIGTSAADDILNLIRISDYQVDRILETHGRREHRTSAWYLRTQLYESTGQAPRVCLGKSIAGVQRMFRRKHAMHTTNWTEAFDDGFTDGERFKVGELTFHVLRLPGHTPDHVGYMVGDTVFVGDAIYKPEAVGDQTDMAQLWKSTQKLLSLPDYFHIHTAHDDPPEASIPRSPDGKGPERTSATIARTRNNHIAGLTEAEFATLCRRQGSPQRTAKVPRHVRPNSARSCTSSELADDELPSPMYLPTAKLPRHMRNRSTQSALTTMTMGTMGSTKEIGRAVAIPLKRLASQRT